MFSTAWGGDLGYCNSLDSLEISRVYTFSPLEDWCQVLAVTAWYKRWDKGKEFSRWPNIQSNSRVPVLWTKHPKQWIEFNHCKIHFLGENSKFIILSHFFEEQNLLSFENCPIFPAGTFLWVDDFPAGTRFGGIWFFSFPGTKGLDGSYHDFTASPVIKTLVTSPSYRWFKSD